MKRPFVNWTNGGTLFCRDGSYRQLTWWEILFLRIKLTTLEKIDKTSPIRKPKIHKDFKDK